MPTGIYKRIKPISEETRKKLTGENNHNWKGGVYKDVNKYMRDRRKANPEKLRAYNKKWQVDNREKYNGYMKAWRLKVRVAVVKFYSGGTMSCACCGENHYEFLSVDHINGGGKKDRRMKEKQGSLFYTWIIKNGFPDGYRILCHNCNQAIGFYGKCPHGSLDKINN